MPPRTTTETCYNALNGEDGLGFVVRGKMKECQVMWTVIYIAQSSKAAEQIENKLSKEGFLVKVRQVNVAKQQYEILVPESELDEVQEVLKDILHSSL